MTISITEDKITSPDTHHAAVRVTISQWRVTWLRHDERITRTQAITAMQLAAVVGAADERITRQDPIWGHVNSWAHELGLEGEGAIGYAMQPRKWEA